MADGNSYDIFFEDLNSAYMGVELEKEAYTGFDAAVSEEYAVERGGYKKAALYMTIFFRGLKSSRFRFLTKKKIRPGKGWQNIKCQFQKKRPLSSVKDWELRRIHSLPEFLES